MTWKEAGEIKIVWEGCQYYGRTIHQVAQTDEGLLWLHDKMDSLAPWQKERKAIRVYLKRSIVQAELHRVLDEKRREGYDEQDREEEREMREFPW